MKISTPRRAFSSAKQVAELAGVSRSAVSRTFTPGASVSEETKQRVLRAAEQLGYHVNHLARGLLRRSSGIVCLIASDTDTPFQARVLRVLSERLRDAGKVAMILNTSGPDDHAQAALRQTLNYRAEATIVLSGTPHRTLIRTCLDNGQRLILINRDDRLPGPCNLSVDNHAAAQTALDVFLRAGCRRPALVTSAAGTPSLVARERAFVDCAAQQGIAVMVWREGRTGYDTGAEGARALLAGRHRPDAAFCVTDLIGCGFLDAARRDFGLDVPRDLCVIGFDNIEQTSWSSYRMTTFAPPVEEIAAHAVRIATLSPDDRQSEQRMVFQAPLIWRDTVRPEGKPSHITAPRSTR